MLNNIEQKINSNINNVRDEMNHNINNIESTMPRLESVLTREGRIEIPTTINIELMHILSRY